MNILVINCHVANRGDEAAVHALVDELNILYDKLSITLSLRGDTVYPNMPENVMIIHQFIPRKFKSLLAYYIGIVSNGKIRVSSSGKKIMDAIEKADIILHAPGGPSIGDTYYEDEPTYLRVYDLIQAMNKPYIFYAPSMGPFSREDRNEWRKKVLCGAKAIILRDPISAEYVRKLLPDKQVYQTLDSAFQNNIEIEINKKKLDEYKELNTFLCNHDKCVGVTITDLLWHPIHSNNKRMVQNIHDSFEAYLKELVDQGYGIVFIPQLYGSGNDYNLMKGYVAEEDNYFVILDNDERYDAYFQQYVIGRLYAVIGMRYHSNIFSAKMGTPFISVSYEQKMQGFMEKMNLRQYCIKLDDLSAYALKNKYELLCRNYDEYKIYLNDKHEEMKADACRTTQIVERILEE